MHRGTRRQSMLLSQTGQERIYSLNRKLNDSLRWTVYRKGESSLQQREDMNGEEGRLATQRWNGKQRKWEETSRRISEIVPFCLTLSRHLLCQQVNREITFHTAWSRCHSDPIWFTLNGSRRVRSQQTFGWWDDSGSSDMKHWRISNNLPSHPNPL